ncbi:GPI inositol-deacylase [Paramyrothecium foliicola]|nr:GPI inositol-deacylase [Paramyrothecium foliicola]
MKRHSPESTDDDNESSLESDNPNGKPGSSITGLTACTSPSRSRQLSSLNWRHAEGRNGLPSNNTTNHSTALSPPAALDAPSKKSNLAKALEKSQRNPWSVPILVLIATAMGMALLFGILHSSMTRPPDPKGCRMSYMRPSYVHFAEFDTEHTRFATKYSLYLYREQGVDPDRKLHGIPVLFIPGNAGSYKQVRPIAAEAANHFYHYLQHEGLSTNSRIRNLDFFTVDFNEDITAFHGQTLLDQAEYLNEAVRFILSLYSDPYRASRDSSLPDPTSVIILGHSMGGVVARTMLIQPNYQSNSINTIITMSAPHARPPVTFDGQIVRIYDDINDYWRRAYLQKWANNNPLWHVTLVSIAGGSLDTVVPSDYASLESLVPETHGFTVFTSGIPTVWTSMDHQAILWCDQFRKVVARALFDIVDVHRASQTRPRADRMRAFRKRFLTGLEDNAEKLAPGMDSDTVLTIDDNSKGILPAGERLLLKSLGGGGSRPQIHLMPVPPSAGPRLKRFTLLTDSRLDGSGESGQLEVLLCNFSPIQAVSVGPSIPFSIDMTTSGASGSSKLACKNTAPDAILLPPSTSRTRNPFYLQGEQETIPFSYLRYDLSHIAEYQFIAIVDKATPGTAAFVIAEFVEEDDFSIDYDISLNELLTSGVNVKLPGSRPMTVELRVPSLKSSLLSYKLDINNQNASRELFTPLVRQHLESPHESRYFVNAKHATVALHGVAPYLPPALKPKPENGVAFEFWTDPGNGAELDIRLKIDVLGSLGKLYMRYRTVFAAFPLLIVTLALRKQFRVYDETGIFISFTRALDLSLRHSIPLLLLSLTLLSLSLSGASDQNSGFPWISKAPVAPLTRDFASNDLLVGTGDPFYWFLTPIIGVVSVGVCAALHFVMQALTHTFALLYGLLSSVSCTNNNENRRRASSPAFVPSTPRRRMVTTAVLLFLVATFIPYQFAYLVACLVQLFTTIRALRIHMVTSSVSNSNYHHYSHSILLLMLWVLPINLPILAVWIRNLAVHWLTPFSSHHNVLSIMPFILLVENLTTGRMVPQMSSGLRYINSILLFGTALCAGVYGVSHAYVLHHLVDVVAAWLVIVHSTANSWSLAGLSAMFDGHSTTRKTGKTP